ncbi:hypothetical protein FTX61_02115 [Nitriliruptoraceae bacterium ZYF776]|nr:hypothetical protein [Profundirhabdus halotolerans]
MAATIRRRGTVHVAILGAGRLGGTLAELLGRHGHEVSVAARRPAAELAARVEGWPNVTAVDRPQLVGADVVVLAFPWRDAQTALAGLDLAGHVVADATNPFSADFEVLDTGTEGATGTISRLLPGARVVKAFNTLPAELYDEAARGTVASAERVGIPVAADDVDAADEVADLLGDLGFTAVNVGGLAAGRDLMEPASPLFNVPLPARELEQRVAQLRG